MCLCHQVLSRPLGQGHSVHLSAPTRLHFRPSWSPDAAGGGPWAGKDYYERKCIVMQTFAMILLVKAVLWHCMGCAFQKIRILLQFSKRSTTVKPILRSSNCSSMYFSVFYTKQKSQRWILAVPSKRHRMQFGPYRTHELDIRWTDITTCWTICYSMSPTTFGLGWKCAALYSLVWAGTQIC